MDEVWGEPSPIQTKIECEFDSGPLTRGLAIPVTRSVIMSGYDGSIFGGFPSGQPCPISKHRVEVDDLNRQYRTQTKTIVVDKRTHRIRYENETEHEVTVVIEPK